MVYSRLRMSHLVRLMGSSGSSLPLVTRGELGKVSMIVALPILCQSSVVLSAGWTYIL